MGSNPQSIKPSIAIGSMLPCTPTSQRILGGSSHFNSG